jgi:hypothetical protein
MSDTERINSCFDTLYGPQGKPELSLIVRVNAIGKQVQLLMKFGWSMALLGSGLVIKEIFVLLTHAG